MKMASKKSFQEELVLARLVQVDQMLTSVIEQAPDIVIQHTVINKPYYILTLSAKTDEALKRYIEHLLVKLNNNPAISLADVSFTLNVCRTHFKKRFSLVVSSIAEACEKLKMVANGEKVKNAFLSKEE